MFDNCNFILARTLSNLTIVLIVVSGLLLHISCSSGSSENPTLSKIDPVPTYDSPMASVKGSQDSYANDLSTHRTVSNLIIDGRSVGQLKIGDTDESATLHLGKASDSEEYARWGCPGEKMNLWIEDTNEGASIFSYSKKNIIYQIETASDNYVTEVGISPGDTERELSEKYPDLVAFELLNSAEETDSVSNLIFHVDQKRGIAFIFQSDKLNESAKINRIVVFDPQLEYAPAGCIRSPQKFQKLTEKKRY